MSTENDVIAALKEKIKEYESLLKEVFDDTKDIGKVISGPLIENGKKFYRINLNGKDFFAVSLVNDIIEPGSEVIVKETHIARVLPKLLSLIKEPAPFKKVEWNEIGGLKSQVYEIRKQVEGYIQHANTYKEFGIEPIKGILLYGPPGCGKTLIANVIASSIIKNNKADEDSFVYIKGPELLSMYVGNTEEKIRTIFSECRIKTKKTGIRSIIFIDEADALLSKRGDGISSDVNKTIVPQFLSEMDGFDENSPFILLSTNYPESLDPAILREGRIDLKIEIKRPGPEDAIDIFNIHLNKVKVYDPINKLSERATELLYQKSVKVTGAMIKTISNLSAQEALHRFSKTNNKKGIIEEDMINAIDKVINSQIL